MFSDHYLSMLCSWPSLTWMPGIGFSRLNEYEGSPHVVWKRTVNLFLYFCLVLIYRTSYKCRNWWKKPWALPTDTWGTFSPLLQSSCLFYLPSQVLGMQTCVLPSLLHTSCWKSSCTGNNHTLQTWMTFFLKRKKGIIETPQESLLASLFFLQTHTATKRMVLHR